MSPTIVTQHLIETSHPVEFERVAKRTPRRTRAEKFATAQETLGWGLAFILEAALRTTVARGCEVVFNGGQIGCDSVILELIGPNPE